MGSKLIISLFLGLCLQGIAGHIIMDLMMNHHPWMMFPMHHHHGSGAPTAAPTAAPTTKKPLTGDTESSFRVVDQLCSLNDSTIAPIAQQFGSGCYDQVPKAHFAACQNQIFGCTWDTLACIKTNCPRFHAVYQSYVDCIVGRFTAANLTIATLFESGTKINVCQGALVGL